MKLVALYLPQFHRISENDMWWGDGYTEWTAVKRARPLFAGHYQPHIPLNDRYYDLSEENAETWKWQAFLAEKYGISAFCIYHYWFCNGHQLLEKPAEILLKHKEIFVPFFFCWANESWTRTWYGLQKEILMEQSYGDELEWKKHFEYLLPFFRDPRYFRIEGKPVFCLYKSKDFQSLQAFMKTWNVLAIKAGFQGIYWISANTNTGTDERLFFDAKYNFEPDYSLKVRFPSLEKKKYLFLTGSRYWLNKIRKRKLLERTVDSRKIYRTIIKSAIDDRNSPFPIYSGVFPSWDNTPRRNYLGLVYTHTSPSLFFETLNKLQSIVPQDALVFINAWNEWGEGCHLEPDKRYGYSYLEALKRVEHR